MTGRLNRWARRLIADQYTGRAIEDDVVDWAVAALEAGAESQSVLLLAASDKPANWFETAPVFRAALIERGLGWPDRDVALFDGARALAEAVLAGAADPGAAVADFQRYARASDDADNEFWFIGDDLRFRYGFEPNSVRPEHWAEPVRAACERLLASPLPRSAD